MRVVLLLASSCVSCAGGNAGRAVAPAGGTQSVEVGSAHLGYVVEGSGAPCLVFGSRILMPRTFSSDFKSHFRCVYLDPRGCSEGVPDDPAHPDGVFRMVADVEAARAKLALDHFVLVGHSLLGLVAMAYATQYPEHVSRVIAIEAPPEMTQRFLDASDAAWNAASAERKAQHEKNRARLPKDFADKLPPSQAFVADFVANAAMAFYDPTYDPGPLFEGVYFNVPLVTEAYDPTRPFVLPTAPAVSVPVFATVARGDFLVPAAAWDGFKGPFTNMTVKVFEHSGHFPQLEEASAFDAAVQKWLAL